MVKNISYSVVFLLVGLLIGWVGHCAYSPKESPTEVISVRTDTIREWVEVKVPVPVTKYVFRTDSIFSRITDSVYLEYYVDRDEPIPVHVYQDSIQNLDYKFKYDISTCGQLLDFKYDLSIYPKTEVVVVKSRPKWVIISGISNKGNFKFGGGYKGWTVEAELNTNLNQVFFGYQYQF